MNIKAILFDLDGTLLPMDQEAFTRAYFKELAAAISPLGIEPKKLVDIVWAGTYAMVKNNGLQTNEETFWKVFADLSGADVNLFKPSCDLFYNNEFHKAKAFTGDNPLATHAVRLAHANGRKVILASNPIFPLVGHASRLSWIGLKPEDFDMVTSYETDRYCKPNPAYYSDICARIDIPPEECLMIGNDETEDMLAASSIGMKAFLVTDCMIPSKNGHWTGSEGTFAELIEYIKNI